MLIVFTFKDKQIPYGFCLLYQNLKKV